jgi:hypothetical protein
MMTEDEAKEVRDNMMVAFMVSLAQDNIRPDIQEVLLHGSLQNGVRSNAVSRALAASLKVLKQAEKDFSNDS